MGILNMKEITTSYLANEVKGKLIGDIKHVKCVFTFLNLAKPGDVVIRHWIDEKGVLIASKKGVSCIITQNPTVEAVETSKKLKLPIIITSKIELANAFALKWAIKIFAKDSIRVVVTGTNGKSTTAHMVYNILKLAGYNTYTNTDAKSEFNTLIDPVVAVQIAEFENITNESIQAMVIEVSEVQGWLDKLMKNHACIMTSAIDPNVLIVTNVGLDHIGLVNSIDETFNEIYGSLEAISSKSKQDKNNLRKRYAILNSDDPMLLEMGELIQKQDDINLLSHGSIENGSKYQNITLKSDGIYHCSKLFLKKEELPFSSKHFLQNTMAAIDACLALNIDKKVIKQGISSYRQLERRFTILDKDPLIIDDFAHNPDGIVATIKSAAKMSEGSLYIVFAIRGSRGSTINGLNTEALVKGLEGLDYVIIITSSAEAVDYANTVKKDEMDIVIKTLMDNNLEYVYHENLYNALEYSLKSAKKTDTILLIGAQGMDPASQAIININKKLDIK
jgi:UDP-N-acetylmuramoyl-L-alanyl-D-glutamate--2,6-diaminopimelate ligase